MFKIELPEELKNMLPKKKKKSYPNEKELSDSYPINAGCLYVINDEVKESHISCNCLQYKNILEKEGIIVESLKNCDIFARSK